MKEFKAWLWDSLVFIAVVAFVINMIMGVI